VVERCQKKWLFRQMRGVLHCSRRWNGARSSTGSSSLCRFQPGDVTIQPLTEIESGLVERLFRDGCPQVKLISDGAALEALEGVFGEVDREYPAAFVRAMKQTWAPALLSRRLTRLKAEKFKHISHRDQCSHFAKVDAAHGPPFDQRRGIRTRSIYQVGS